MVSSTSAGLLDVDAKPFAPFDRATLAARATDLLSCVRNIAGPEGREKKERWGAEGAEGSRCQYQEGY